MASAAQTVGVCFGGKGKLHLIPNKTKVNAKLYVETLLPEHVQDCRSLLLSGFVFQQAHTAKLAQDWIATNCSESRVNGDHAFLWEMVKFDPSQNQNHFTG